MGAAPALVFPHVPLCRANAEIGCVISFSSFRAEAPPAAGPPFEKAPEGMVPSCANPAALEGGFVGDRHLGRLAHDQMRLDPKLASAYNNRGVILYEEKKYGAAVKEYRRAIAIDSTSASFFSNLGAALFAKKEFEKAIVAYQHAVQLDPDVFERTSRGGVQAQLPSPQDRARYDYTVAKLYAKMGFFDRSLEYLKKALGEGYKDFKNVYKDSEFAELRKDKRFTELVAMKYPALPE